MSDEFFRSVLMCLVLERCKPKLWYQNETTRTSPWRKERIELRTIHNRTQTGEHFIVYYNNSIRLQEYAEYKSILHIYQISKITINYIAAEKYTKHNWKWYTDTELSEHRSSCKSGPCGYKSTKPKLLAARAENRGTQS